MAKLSPADMLKRTTMMAAALRGAKGKKILVGLPLEKVGGKVYGNGMSIIRIGAIHEYGFDKVPQRSFLRVPLAIKSPELAARILKEFQAVAEDKRSLDDALDRVGIAAVNIVKGAFRANGYGTWRALDPRTVKAKGSATPLFDNGILLGSITWVVR